MVQVLPVRLLAPVEDEVAQEGDERRRARCHRPHDRGRLRVVHLIGIYPVIQEVGRRGDGRGRVENEYVVLVRAKRGPDILELVVEVLRVVRVQVLLVVQVLRVVQIAQVLRVAPPTVHARTSRPNTEHSWKEVR